MTIIENIISKLLALGQEFFEYIFDGVNFSVLWSWCPSDIQSAATAFIAALFALAIIRAVRVFLPF